MHPANSETQSRAFDLADRFARRFGSVPQVYRAPGRVNLIGEHTDYNDGLVMPVAINFSTLVAIAPRADGKLVIDSENYQEQVEFEVDHLPRHRTGNWSDYSIGVAEMLSRSGRQVLGANLMVEGDVPQGAGLSSSASIEVGIGYALLDIRTKRAHQPEMDRTELALLCQKAENEFVGARCGIMDQFIAAHGKRGNALLLDCRCLEFRHLPVPDGIALIVSNTMVKHSIAAGEYNQRRMECETAVHELQKHLPGMRALRDVTLQELEEHGHALTEVVRRRCRHVISENARVEQAAEALEHRDLQQFGQLMLESHRSLRDDYEVSCRELDLMVELAIKIEGVYGSRMTGGGFGGCTISLLPSDKVPEFERAVVTGYERACGRVPEIYVCSAADGVSRVA